MTATIPAIDYPALHVDCDILIDAYRQYDAARLLLDRAKTRLNVAQEKLGRRLDKEGLRYVDLRETAYGAVALLRAYDLKRPDEPERRVVEVQRFHTIPVGAGYTYTGRDE